MTKNIQIELLAEFSKILDDLKDITDRDAVDHFMLFCSLDSWGEQAEYIRNGLDFDMLYKNVTQYLRESKKHSLTFIITANLLSLPNWLEYIKQIHKLRCEFNTDRQLIWFDTPMLHDPKWMSMKLATPKLLKSLQDSIDFMKEHPETALNRFKGFKDYEVDKVKRLLAWASEPLNTSEELKAKKNFNLFFTEHDKRRNTNINLVFPELKEFIEECKNK